MDRVLLTSNIFCMFLGLFLGRRAGLDPVITNKSSSTSSLVSANVNFFLSAAVLRRRLDFAELSVAGAGESRRRDSSGSRTPALLSRRHPGPAVDGGTSPTPTEAGPAAAAAGSTGNRNSILLTDERRSASSFSRMASISRTAGSSAAGGGTSNSAGDETGRQRSVEGHRVVKDLRVKSSGSGLSERKVRVPPHLRTGKVKLWRRWDFDGGGRCFLEAVGRYFAAGDDDAVSRAWEIIIVRRQDKDEAWEMDEDGGRSRYE